MVGVFGQKIRILYQKTETFFLKKLQNPIRFGIIRTINSFIRKSYFLKHLPEIILKSTETSKESQIFEEKKLNCRENE